MIALISDIHANLEALCRVITDCEEQGISQIYCLGDIVGYGADPEACVDMIMERVTVAIMGNHDHALIHGPDGFNSMAREMIHKTQKLMDPTDHTEYFNEKESFYFCNHSQMSRCLFVNHTHIPRWNFIKQLQRSYVQETFLLVHGSALDPTFEYVLPDKFAQSWNPVRLTELFEAFEERLCFCGHTHHPCAISSDLTCFYPHDDHLSFQLDPQKKYSINVGSVGQPRDGDNRACYLQFDESTLTIQWRRIEYDIAAAAAKIDALCGAETWCSQRLFLGK